MENRRRRRLAGRLAALVIVIAGCQAAAPTASPIEDPKEILAQTLLSLKDVQTIRLAGEVTGQVRAMGLELDLEGTRIEGAIDVAGEKTRLSVSAPALMGTAGELISLDGATYLKLTGPIAGLIGADPGGRYLKQDIDSVDGAPGDIASDPQKAIDGLRAMLDLLPVTPRKAPDDRCGDRVCYHLTMTLTRSELEAMDPTAETLPQSIDFELYTQKDDLRPAIILVAINDEAGLGTFRMQFMMAYDGAVSIEAPPADQVVEQ